ncbi:MAG: glycosyltransferase family 2 protein [Bacillota bacterium]|nr:glycosyltransferase family 2 protein [Bacillota bacterium]
METIKKIDIIVPCFNEGRTLDIFVDEVTRAVSSVAGYRFTYIFIDDGSTDNTLEKIRSFACQEHTAATEQDVGKAAGIEVRYISFSRNFGKEAAMYAGLKASRGDYALIMDADLQHPPQLIRQMIDKLEETGSDSCAARRVSRKGEPRIRSVFARMFYKIMNRFSDIEIVDGVVDFRLMSRQMVRAIVSMPENQRFSKGIFAWVGFETCWIEFENVERIAGESKWSVWGLAKYAVDGFIDFAVSPLKFVGVFGGITAVGSMVYFIAEIIKTIIVGKDVPGYASTICLILFFGGLIIAILSVIGEYIGRMYLETKGRPVYIEKESNIDEEIKPAS